MCLFLTRRSLILSFPKAPSRDRERVRRWRKERRVCVLECDREHGERHVMMRESAREETCTASTCKQATDRRTLKKRKKETHPRYNKMYFQKSTVLVYQKMFLTFVTVRMHELCAYGLNDAKKNQRIHVLVCFLEPAVLSSQFVAGPFAAKTLQDGAK